LAEGEQDKGIGDICCNLSISLTSGRGCAVFEEAAKERSNDLISSLFQRQEVDVCLNNADILSTSRIILKKAIRIMIVFYSRYGNTAQMAEEIAYGAKAHKGVGVAIRRIADIEEAHNDLVAKKDWTKLAEDLNDTYPTTPLDQIIAELPSSDAIIFGSPTRFGNMAAPLKAMWDSTADLWLKGSLVGKVGAVFTSAASVHGGQESTAISMLFPMLHHGMVIVGVPYSVPELTESGSPYGASRIVGKLANKPIEEADMSVARALGSRVAEIAFKLS
jgi:NAD(P)H dehydrogenase (quinone)